MSGAIIGDIAGSRFEFNPTNDYNFELFTPDCSYTDDTICTIAIADADTLGAIVGSMAEAIWGIPEDMKKKALSYLPKEMRDVLQAFRKACLW